DSRGRHNDAAGVPLCQPLLHLRARYGRADNHRSGDCL
ncbi:MAG: hypothetical protein AVDCRST_MAG01-01-428, partial [uncultured Rubrobacteraceae bacterium]